MSHEREVVALGRYLAVSARANWHKPDILLCIPSMNTDFYHPAFTLLCVKHYHNKYITCINQCQNDISILQSHCFFILNASTINELAPAWWLVRVVCSNIEIFVRDVENEADEICLNFERWVFREFYEIHACCLRLVALFVVTRKLI